MAVSPFLVECGPGYTARTSGTAIFYFNYAGDKFTYWFKGDADKAVADYTVAIRRKPDYRDAYYNRGWIHTTKGDYDRAIADFTAAIRCNPKDASAHYNRGVAYRHKGDFDRAIADLTKVLQLDPEGTDAYYIRGLAYQQKGDCDKAIADHTEAVRLNPKLAEAYYNRGLAYEKKGDQVKADADFAKARKLGYQSEPRLERKRKTEFFRKLFGAKPRAAPEEDNPEESIRPSPQRVAQRALVLAALRFRAELESDPDAEELRREVVRWIDVLNLGDELEPRERDLLRTPIGRADQPEIVTAAWRSEGLAVIAWALRRFEMPAYDQYVDNAEVVASVGFSQDLLCAHDTAMARRLLHDAALRPESEISRFAGHITIVSWRLRQFLLNRQAMAYSDLHPELKQSIPSTCGRLPMDFAAYLRRHPMFQEHWFEGLRLVGGDLAIGAHSIAEAPLDKVNDCGTIAEERQIAVYWLQGDNRVYSEVSPDTFLSAC